jgi:hypothetical protein
MHHFPLPSRFNFLTSLVSAASASAIARYRARARDTHDRASLPRCDSPWTFPHSSARVEIKRRAATKLSQRGGWPQCAAVLVGSLHCVELLCKGADLQERRQRQTVRGDLCGGGLDVHVETGGRASIEMPRWYRFGATDNM